MCRLMHVGDGGARRDLGMFNGFFCIYSIEINDSLKAKKGGKGRVDNS